MKIVHEDMEKAAMPTAFFYNVIIFFFMVRKHFFAVRSIFGMQGIKKTPAAIPAMLPKAIPRIKQPFMENRPPY